MFSARIALRYLFSKKSHNSVNVISMVALAGVAVATAAIVCVLSVFNGFADLAQTRLSRISPQLMITPAEGKEIASADSICRALEDLATVDRAAATITEQALVMWEGTQIPVTAKGVPDDYAGIVSIDSVMIDGSFAPHFDVEGDTLRGATLSIGAALNSGARPYADGTLRLFTPRRRGRINPAVPMASFREDSLVVTGVYRVDETEFDQDMVVVPFDVMSAMLDYDRSAGAIELRLAPDADEAKALEQVKALLGPGFTVRTRLQQGEQSFRMISIEKWITFAMLVFILVIASFNVISTLSMLVIEKEENIDTMRALGATPRQISRIFMLEGWLISLIGGLVGMVLGVALCLAQQHFGLIRLNGDPGTLSITAYPVRVEPVDLLTVMAVVILTGLIIGWVAARLARIRG